MVRPIGRPTAMKAISLEDLREEFLAHCEARNLSRQDRRVVRRPHTTVHRLVRNPGDRLPFNLHWSDLERFVLHCRRQGFAPNTVHAYAQVLKTLCRRGHRLGYIPGDFEMPRVGRRRSSLFSHSNRRSANPSRSPDRPRGGPKRASRELGPRSYRCSGTRD
jgi:hypothetical protein